jgi:aspartate kinase
MDGSRGRKIVVIKIGGSVLPDSRSYSSVARFLRRRLHSSPGGRFVVVVSAQEGVTSALEILAREITKVPVPRSLDLLLSTGEIRSVALLTLHLEAMGVTAVGLNIHEVGLRLDLSSLRPVPVVGTLLQSAIGNYSVVVVPGFFATTEEGLIRSLGRGGSDLSAVLLAGALGATQCELVKDVPGYFSRDPHKDQEASPLPTLSYERAILMARSGCELVQQGALEAAERAGIPLVVRSMSDDDAYTVVSADGQETLSCTKAV